MISQSKPKRVLIIRNAMPYDFGGAERFAVDLAHELQQLGWQPLVVSRHTKLLEYAQQQAVAYRKGLWWRHQHWNGKWAPLFPVYLVWQLVLTAWYLQLMVRFRPHVVHAQGRDDFIAASLAARLLGKRVIWTDHADLKYIYANNRVWYKNPVGKLVRMASKLAHHITLVSQSEKLLITDALGHEPGERYQVIYNGVTGKTVQPRERSDSTFIFCATSRLVQAKGIGEQIKAFTAFNKQHPASELWLVGDGPNEAEFKKLAADTPGVTFFGHSDTPLEFVAACDVFVHPSYHEGFSISLIEATMLGKPIIACNVGGNSEIIHDHQTGLLAEARSAQQLQTAMEELYTNRDLAAQLGAAAKKQFDTSFRFEKIVAEGFVPLYEK
jgi:glycosyltransferase involved in cell wall biosynthesis